MTLGQNLVQPSRMLTGHPPTEYLSPKIQCRVIASGSFNFNIKFPTYRMGAQEMLMILLLL